MAGIYLDIQSNFWPQYCPGIVKKVDRDSVIKEMVQGFQSEFLSQDAWNWKAHIEKYAHGTKLGQAYVRYSCDNSNPRSLSQQLRNILERAHRDGVFIPWEFVLADAAVTGTIAARRGYQMVKALITEAGEKLQYFYIDELGRASRDHIEALTLGKLVSQKQKRMIGVTDGFDSDNPQSKVMLTIFAMLHEMFIDQLRSKVNRGMRDAFEQGRNVRPAAIGYRLVPQLGDDGQPIIGRKGVPLKTREIDPEQAPRIIQCFELFVEKLWSRKRIAQLFNRERVGGKTTWDSSRVRQILRCETYAGFEHQNRIYRVIDSATGVGVTRTRPAEEWQRREVPELAILSSDLFERAQKRLAEQRETFKANGLLHGQRSQLSPSLLIRPICGYCGKLLWLGNSGQHPSLCCINGRDRKADCQLTSYKSVRIINQVLLGFVLDQLLSEERLTDLVDQANQFLVEMAKQPQGDTSALERELRETKAKRDKLIHIMESSDTDGLEGVLSRIREYERKFKLLETELAEVRSRNQPVPPPLQKGDIVELLRDLPELLKGEIALAASLLQKLTGDVVVTQKREAGKRGATWIADFTWDFVPISLELAQRKKSPTTKMWEYLSTRNWRHGESTTIPLETPVRYQVLAPIVLRQYKAGSCLKTIAAANKISWEYAKALLRYAQTGQRPEHRQSKHRKKRNRQSQGEQPKQLPKFLRVAEQVRHMREVELLSLPAIQARFKAEGLDIGIGTLSRAYDAARLEMIAEAAESGRPVRRGTSRR